MRTRKAARKLSMRDAAPNPGAPPWRRHALAVLAIWSLALIAYSNSFDHLFTFDSNPAILQDSRVWSATTGNLDPEHQPFVAQLAALYRKLDATGCAMVSTGRRLALNSNCPLVRSNTCEAAQQVADLYRKTGREAEAAQLGQIAASEWGCPARMGK